MPRWSCPRRWAASSARCCWRELILKWAASPEMRGDGDFSLVANSPAAALSLAGELARLMDDMTMRQVSWDRLDELVPHDLDAFWQKTLRFLAIAREYWPARLAEKGRIEPAERRDRLIAAEAKRLAGQQRPGDRGGLDRLDPGDREAARHHRHAAARRAGAARPRHRSRRRDLEHDRQRRRRADARAIRSSPWPALLARIGIVRGAVTTLGGPEPHGRERLTSEALRPAAASELWRERLAKPDFAAHADAAMKDIAVIEAANAEEEALAIAVTLARGDGDAGQDRGAGDAGPGAGPPRAGGAAALECAGRRFRRRWARRHAGRACSRGSPRRPRSTGCRR